MKARADRRLEEALGSGDTRDPRPYFRSLLRYLRQRNPDGFERAIRHFEDVLVPAVAEDADPLAEWQGYGRLLAEQVPGRTVSVDGEGRAAESSGASAGSALLLHLPDDPATPALVLRCPVQTTPAQNATLELLVLGRVTASAYE